MVLTISVDQETPRAQLQKIPGQIRALIEVTATTCASTARTSPGSAPTSFDFEAVYFVSTPDYARHMDILQDINLRLVEGFEKEASHSRIPSQRLVPGAGGGCESQLVEIERRVPGTRTRNVS